MRITPYTHPLDQMAVIDEKSWRVSRLFELTRNFKVMEIPLTHLTIHYNFQAMSLRDMVGHVIAVNEADLSTPIIMDMDGTIMDGRHRIMKAIITGAKTIKAVRFEDNPEPDHTDSTEE